MHIDDLVEYFRRQVQDELTDTSGSDTYALFSDDEILQYAWEAQNEFCHQVDHLADATTPEVTQVTVTQDEPWVDLHESITNIRRARTTLRKRTLILRNSDEMETSVMDDDYCNPGFSKGWEDVTGQPTHLILDLEPDRGRLAPIPVQNDVIQLFVYRLPICDVRAGADLEIKEEHRAHLVLWMKHLAYRKADSEIQDEQLADAYHQRWLAYLRDADTRNKVKRKRQYAVRYGGY